MGLLGPVCSPGRSYKQDHVLMWHSGMKPSRSAGSRHPGGAASVRRSRRNFSADSMPLDFRMKVLQSTLRKQYTHGLPSAAPAFSCFPFFILRQRDTLAAIHISTLGLYSYPNNAAPVTYPRCRIFNVIFQFQYVFAFSAGTHPEIPHRIRACLKIGDVPSGEGFWAAGKQFFAGILADFKEKLCRPGDKRSADWAC